MQNVTYKGLCFCGILGVDNTVQFGRLLPKFCRTYSMYLQGKTELGGRRFYVIKYQSFFFGQFLERRFILLLIYVKIFVTVSSRCVMTDPYTGCHLVSSFIHDCQQCYLRFQNNVITLLVIICCFRHICKIVKSDCLLHYVRPSVCLPTCMEQLDKFS